MAASAAVSDEDMQAFAVLMGGSAVVVRALALSARPMAAPRLRQCS